VGQGGNYHHATHNHNLHAASTPLVHAGGVVSGSGGNSTSMSIERGRELYLSGRDGAVYKGRDATAVTIAPGDPSRPANFQVHYTNALPGGASAAPTTNARGTTIVDHKTVPAPYSVLREGVPPPSTPQRGGAQLARPSSAPYNDPAMLGAGQQQQQQHSPQAIGSGRSGGAMPSLPPTRPATRAGLRSRDGAAARHSPSPGPSQAISEEHKTPTRQQFLEAESF